MSYFRGFLHGAALCSTQLYIFRSNKHIQHYLYNGEFWTQDHRGCEPRFPIHSVEQIRSPFRTIHICWYESKKFAGMKPYEVWATDPRVYDLSDVDLFEDLETGEEYHPNLDQAYKDLEQE